MPPRRSRSKRARRSRATRRRSKRAAYRAAVCQKLLQRPVIIAIVEPILNARIREIIAKKNKGRDPGDLVTLKNINISKCADHFKLSAWLEVLNKRKLAEIVIGSLLATPVDDEPMTIKTVFELHVEMADDNEHVQINVDFDKGHLGWLDPLKWIYELVESAFPYKVPLTKMGVPS